MGDAPPTGDNNPEVLITVQTDTTTTAIYLRCAVKEPEEHEESVGLAEGGGDDAEGVHDGDDDQDLLTAKRVGGTAPAISARHHADEDDRVEPSLGLGVEVEVALGCRQDEGHRDDVHLLRSAHEAKREGQSDKLAIHKVP